MQTVSRRGSAVAIATHGVVRSAHRESDGARMHRARRLGRRRMSGLWRASARRLRDGYSCSVVARRALTGATAITWFLEERSLAVSTAAYAVDRRASSGRWRAVDGSERASAEALLLVRKFLLRRLGDDGSFRVDEAAHVDGDDGGSLCCRSWAPLTVLRHVRGREFFSLSL